MLDRVILRHLIHTEEYCRKVLPFLKEEYFERRSSRALFKIIGAYIDRYNSMPTREALAVDLSALRGSGMNDDEFKEAVQFLQHSEPEKTELPFLLDRTELFCQEQAIQNAVITAVSIIEDKSGKLNRGSIPGLLTDALSVSFNHAIGHDYFDDAELRYQLYHEKRKQVPFDISLFNDITAGGFANRTLNIWLAGVHVGKTFVMGHCAAANLRAMKNVLYISLEMSERQISERLDSNILGKPLADLMTMPQEEYLHDIRREAAKTTGKLIVKEYPTASAGANHFRALVNELRIKRNFVPDIIYIDYLNICTSTRFKGADNLNSYAYVKAIAEEVRGLAVELDLPIVSATQLNRQGFKSSDPDMDDTAESFGLPATADFMAALIKTPNDDQLMVKQLKNRYTDVTTLTRFVVGIERPLFRLFDLDASAQKDLIQSEPSTKGSKVIPLNTLDHSYHGKAHDWK